MKYQINWAGGNTEVLGCEDAFLKLAGFVGGERIARMILDETRQKGTEWAFYGNSKEKISTISYKGD